MTRGEIICGIILGLSIAIIVACFLGCTPITLKEVDLSKLPREHALIANVRPCDGLYFCYPWIAPHKMDWFRDSHGDLQQMPEQSNGQGLDTFASPVESAIDHFQWGP